MAQFTPVISEQNMATTITGYKEPALILPTNGKLPGEERPKLANRYNLVKRLRFFNSIDDAAVGANFARAVYARVQSRC